MRPPSLFPLLRAALALLLLACTGCGVMENGADYQFLSAANGWSGKTRYDDSGANVWFDVASASLTVSLDPATNRARIEERVRAIKAARPEVELVLFGETITGWYLRSADPAENEAYQRAVAEPVPGPTTGTVGALAHELGIYVAFGIAEAAGEGLYNSLVLVNPAGEVQAVHRKYLTVHSSVVASLDQPYRNGSGPTVTEIKGVPFGLMICNDMHSLAMAEGFTAAGVEVVLSALADTATAPEAGQWSAIAPVYGSWLVQANRFGTEGETVYPGALSIVDPAGAIRASANDDGWVAARIGVYR